MTEINLTDGFFNFDCPHCGGNVIVLSEDLNCRIFRHAIYRNNYQQVDPHLPQDKCELLLRQNLIHGCCKPFRIYTEDKKHYVTICDYI